LPIQLCDVFLTNRHAQRAFVDRHGAERFEDGGPFAGIARDGYLSRYWWDGRACYVLGSDSPQRVLTVERAGVPYARWLAAELYRLGVVADLPPPSPYADPFSVVPSGGFAVLAPHLLHRNVDSPTLDRAAESEIKDLLSRLAGQEGARDALRIYVDQGISGAYEAFKDEPDGLRIRVTDEAYREFPKRAAPRSLVSSQRVLQWDAMATWLRRVPGRRAVLLLRPDDARIPLADIWAAWKRLHPSLPEADGFFPREAGRADTLTAYDPSRPPGSRWTVRSF
jgi:hypothetical protein